MELIKKPLVICMEIRVKIYTKHLHEFIQLAVEIAKDSRKGEGCLEYLLYRNVEDSYLFYFETLWQSSDELDVHIRSQEFGALLGALFFLTETYEIRINQVFNTGGKEYISELRNQRKIS